jgi:hypothetical protein
MVLRILKQVPERYFKNINNNLLRNILEVMAKLG